MSSDRLTPTSYLVLGLLAREGPSTSYDLERHVAATLGNFWSFPHTLLYSEPARLATLGLVTQRRETGGRQRRVFDITAEGRSALISWLDRPSVEPTEVRDPGLLQLFFADLASPPAKLRLAREQLAIHEAKLAGYREDASLERVPGRSPRGQRTFEQWRGETLVMGELYESAAVKFWRQVVEDATAADPSTSDDSG
jgi:PadR family transcriptional regulator, regulatory protein AphA